MGRCFSSKADMPTTCFCQDVGIAVSDIALYIFQAVSCSAKSLNLYHELVSTKYGKSTGILWQMKI